MFTLRGASPCAGLDVFFMAAFRSTWWHGDVLLRTRAWFGDAVWSFLDMQERGRMVLPRRIDHLLSGATLGMEQPVPLVVID